MTKTTQSLTFFFQEYCEKNQLSQEEIQERFAILQYHAEVEQDTVQVHQPLEVIFAQLRKVRQSKAAQIHHPVQGLTQSHAMPTLEDVLGASAKTAEEKAVLALLQAYFRSDRSSVELLKLSNRLFKLAQAYNKSEK